MKSRTTRSRKRQRRSRFDALRAKPAIYWLKFTGFFLLVGFVGYQSATHAIANIVWQQNPELALRLVPDHPLALSLKADIQFMASQQPASLKKVENLAKKSLEGQSLNPVAVRLLGYVADSRGDTQKARTMLRLAHKISRRDFGTQLWLIEDAVERGDKRRALYHYNIAMRTTPVSHQILFPTLVGALDDPEVRAGLLTYVRQTPDWLPMFLSQAIATSENPAVVADMLIKAQSLPSKVEYESLPNSLLIRLATEHEFLAFRRYYLSLPGSKAATLQSAGLNTFTVNLRYPAAGWQLVENPAIGGGFSAPDVSGRHSVSVFAGSGELMRKYVFLKTGNYRFTASYDATESAPDSEIRWNLYCLSAKKATNIWFTTTAVRQGRSRTTENLSVGPDCPNQALTLQLAGGSGQTGAELTVRSVDLVRQ